VNEDANSPGTCSTHQRQHAVAPAQLSSHMGRTPSQGQSTVLPAQLLVTHHLQTFSDTRKQRHPGCCCFRRRLQSVQCALAVRLQKHKALRGYFACMMPAQPLIPCAEMRAPLPAHLAVQELVEGVIQVNVSSAAWHHKVTLQTCHTQVS